MTSPPRVVAACPATVLMPVHRQVVDMVLQNPVSAAVLERGPRLGAPDWWLTGGALFQTVWNVLTGRDPREGIVDYDVFYFDGGDLSWDAEDAVIRRAAVLLDDLDVNVEIRNQARVHRWYEQRFGVPVEPLTCATEAIDLFAAFACCLGLTRGADGTVRLHAPFGVTDTLGMHLRPNARRAPRQVYDAKVARWSAQWPALRADPWPRH
ncbi:nucleotidyltransferase family protein [Thalassiella azotivora]